MKCNGYSLSTREFVDVEFDAVIQNVDPLLNATGDEKVLLVPGLVDLQVNGFAGADYNSATTPHEEIARSLRAIFSTGVTRFFPTVITAAPEAMLGALRNLASAKESLPDGEAMEGFHVEGPHISPEDGPRGVHSARWVRPPDLDEFSRWQEAAQGNIRLVTLSPEWPESTDYIERLSVQGVATTIGHSRATGDQIRDAVRAGATLSTHLGNAAYAVPLREGNLWDQLAEDRLAASFIADGIHLSDMFLRVALRAKGVERSILITDAVAPSMCPPGPYRVGDIEVELKEDGRVVLRGGDRLAGSSLRMDRGIENLMRRAGLSITEAVTMATINPARVGRVRARQRGLAPGERADLVRLRLEDGRIEILETRLSGRQVYCQEDVPASRPAAR